MRRFTLVELMIVVAIIGILAAIAIPNFYEMQLRAKRSEVPLIVNAGLDGYVVAKLDWSGTEAEFVTAYDGGLGTGGWIPNATLGKANTAWSGGGSFAKLGVEPDGGVYCRYRYTISLICCLSPTPAGAVIHGICDLDGDSGTTTPIQSAYTTQAVYGMNGGWLGSTGTITSPARWWSGDNVY